MYYWNLWHIRIVDYYYIAKIEMVWLTLVLKWVQNRLQEYFSF